MAAQYRPYRDEDSVYGLETTSWTDNEPGTLQIYEKTTEELPFNSVNKKEFWIQIVLFVLTGLLGFLLGYFGPFHQNELRVSEFGEDLTIKTKLLTQIEPEKIRYVLEKYHDTDRTPGSTSDHEFARFVHDSLLDYGLDPVSIANITFEAMTPKQASTVLILNKDNKTVYSNIEQEDYPHDDMRPYLPLSRADAQTITNQVLYVNKGLTDDYAKLQSLGVGVNETDGRIHVIRQTYYQAFEAVMAAQANKAKAVLLFPDPDTYGRLSPFPKSVQLPNDAARSHPLAWSSYGDLALMNFTTLSDVDPSKVSMDKDKVHIPVVPISYKTAEKILRGLAGPQAPKEWNCFDFTLYVGPNYKEENNPDDRDKIRIEFHNQEKTLTVSTVTGVITGAFEPDRYIIVGSRRDSLNRGLLDSVSGTATMLEIARVFGNLTKQGWRPRRTILFSSFGSESLNLLSSNKWFEDHYRLLHPRAVAYINCDLIVSGNRTVTIAASPLLYQVLFNATKQVENPNYSSEQPDLSTVYDAWKDAQSFHKHDSTKGKQNLFKILEDDPEKSLRNTTSDRDALGRYGRFFIEYRKSAAVDSRPKVRRLDLQSMYSQFFLNAGIPVVDVRYGDFQTAEKHDSLRDISDETLPLLGTKYDNLANLLLIDPHLKYHATVAKIISEIIRDLSDSAFLPFNILDYAVTLLDCYDHLLTHHGKTSVDSNLELDSLLNVIQKFALSAADFHKRQDRVDPHDTMKIRIFNDQMMLLERIFLDPNGLPYHFERKHIIIAPNDGSNHRDDFPGLIDFITQLEENLDLPDAEKFLVVLKVHYNMIVDILSAAIQVIGELNSI